MDSGTKSDGMASEVVNKSADNSGECVDGELAANARLQLDACGSDLYKVISEAASELSLWDIDPETAGYAEVRRLVALFGRDVSDLPSGFNPDCDVKILHAVSCASNHHVVDYAPWASKDAQSDGPTPLRSIR